MIGMFRINKMVAAATAIAMLTVLASCGKKPDQSETSSSASQSTTTQGLETTIIETSSKQTTTTTEAPSMNTTTKKTVGSKTSKSSTTTTKPSLGIPSAAQVGSASFKPGTLFKGATLDYRKAGESFTLGAWWWDLKGIVEPVNGVSVDMILDMLIANNVNEIYLDVSKMLPLDEELAQGGLTEDDKKAGLVSERHVRGFIKKCNKYGIRVSALTGAAGDSVLRWIDPANKYFYIKSFIDKIAAYQSYVAADEKFSAIHLDVEPHTHNSWKKNRAKYTQWLAGFVIETRKLCDKVNLPLEFDIWSWFRDYDTVKDETGATVNILDVMTKNCSALGIMSYFYTGAGQFDRATDLELEYAKKNNCRLIAGTETIKLPERNVTYYYAGKEKLIAEQSILRSKLDECGYKKVGGAIHHVYAWYALVK
jgi:hypothetical protein